MFCSDSSSQHALHFLLHFYSIFTFFSLPPLWALDLLHPLNPLPFSLFLRLFIVSPLVLTRPLSYSFFFLSAPTLGSKVSCLTVNVLSFPQREATRWQRENYSVLQCNNLHCVTHTHTHTYVCSPVSVSLVKHIASSSAFVWSYERSQSQSAVPVCLSMVLNSIFYRLLGPG